MAGNIIILYSTHQPFIGLREPLTLTCSINLSVMSQSPNVPTLAIGETVADWRRRYVAATATLKKEEKIALLPVYVNRTKGENEIAHLAAQETEVKAALDKIETLIDGTISLVKLMNSFFEVTGNDKDITSLFFELQAAGKACKVDNSLIMIRFCGLVNNGERFYEDNKAKIVPEMTDTTMLELFQGAKAKLKTPTQVNVKAEKDYVWTASEEPPLWATEIHERLDEIERQNGQSSYNDQLSETDTEESVNYVQRQPKKNMTCYICKKTGHLANTCFRRTCEQCKGKGHDKKDCPSGKRKSQHRYKSQNS